MDLKEFIATGKPASVTIELRGQTVRLIRPVLNQLDNFRYLSMAQMLAKKYRFGEEKVTDMMNEAQLSEVGENATTLKLTVPEMLIYRNILAVASIRDKEGNQLNDYTIEELLFSDGKLTDEEIAAIDKAVSPKPEEKELVPGK